MMPKSARPLANKPPAATPPLAENTVLVAGAGALVPAATAPALAPGGLTEGDTDAKPAVPSPKAPAAAAVMSADLLDVVDRGDSDS